MPSHNVIRLFAAAVIACNAATAFAETMVPLEVHWFLPVRHVNMQDGNQGTLDSLFDVTASGLALMEADAKGVSRITRLGKAPPAFTELRVPEASLYAIAETPDGGVLVTGEVPQWYMEELLAIKAQSMDVVVARIAADGALLWSKHFGGPDRQLGTDVAALSSGGGVVLGTGSVWGMDAEGSLVWSRAFDRSGGAISALPDNRVAIVGGAVHGSGSGFREDAMLWIIDASGKILNQTTMRTGINTVQGAFYEKFYVASNEDSIVALSGVTNRFAPATAPLELAKYDLQGQLVWSVQIRNQDCETDPFVLPNGDVLHACAEAYSEGSPRVMTLFRYAAEDGTAVSNSAVLPECQHLKTSAMVRVIGAEADNAILVGSRPPYNAGQSCTWVGQVPLPR